MTEKQKQEILKVYSEGWLPPDNRPILPWAEDNVSLMQGVYAFPGKFSANRSKFMIKILDEMSNPHRRQINIMAAPRCGKSLMCELFLLHTIVNRPGPTLWLNSTDELMDKFSEMRLIPLLKSCKKVTDILGNKRFSITKKRVIFPTMALNITAGKLSALQSIGYQNAIYDEVWMAPNGHIEEARSRLGDFKSTSKFILASQAGNEFHEWTKEFNRYPVYEWGWKCPSCQKLNTYDFGRVREDGVYTGVKWDKNKDTYDENTGLWDINKAGKTARFVCHHCLFELADNPINRRQMNDNGEYICTQTNGDESGISFRYNAMADIDLKLSTLVKEYLNAKSLWKKEGLIESLEVFYQKRLALPFMQSQRQPKSSDLVVTGYDATLDFGKYKFMTIDCQLENKFYYVIRGWDEAGNSKLIKHGTAFSFEDLRTIQLENKIPDQNVFIDSGSSLAGRVYAKCIEYSHIGLYKGRKIVFSWVATKGADADSFAHADNTKRIWAPEARGDPNMGQGGKDAKTCPLYRFSNKSCKDVLDYLKTGRSTLKWEINVTDKEYHEHMNSEILVDEIDKRTNRLRQIWKLRTATTPNHWFDCEVLQVLAASMVGVLAKL